jgi:hypothetical protein
VNQTLELALTSVLFGAVGILSPTRAALTVLMLTSRVRPWGRAIGFAVGSTLVFAMTALIGLLGMTASDVRDDARINIVIGLVLIAAAAGMAVVHRRRTQLEEPKAVPRHPILSAFGVGAGVSFQSTGRLFILLAGGFRIGQLAGSAVEATVFLVLMLGLWQTPVWGTMVLSLAQPERFAALERRARPALDRIESGIIGAVIVGAFGAWFLLRGLLG